MADLRVTATIAAAAQKGLELHEEGKSGDGLVPATVRDARRMATGEALSEAKVRRMPGWFARHETDKTPGWDEPGNETPGYVAWLLWGGDTARSWAERKVNELDAEQDERALTPADTTAPADEAEERGMAVHVNVMVMKDDYEDEAEEDDAEEPEEDTEADATSEADDEEDAPVERSYSPVRIQYRSSGAGKTYRVIQGYVARTNSMSEDLGGFREIIAPGAFRTALRNADGSPKDVRLLYSHNVEAVLARTGVNMELEEDELGLRMWARVDMSDPDVARVASKMEQGLVDAASFGFTVASDDWQDTPAYPIRTIRQIDTLFEVTICAWPAYPATRVSIMDDAIRSGRLPTGGAARTAPDLVGVSSRDALSGTGTLSAAAWQARLSLRKTQSKRFLP